MRGSEKGSEGQTQLQYFPGRNQFLDHRPDQTRLILDIV